MSKNADLIRVKIKKGSQTINVWPIDLPSWLQAGWKKTDEDETKKEASSDEGSLTENFSEVNKKPGLAMIAGAKDKTLLGELLAKETTASKPRKWCVDALEEQIKNLEDAKEETL